MPQEGERFQEGAPQSGPRYDDYVRPAPEAEPLPQVAPAEPARADAPSPRVRLLPNIGVHLRTAAAAAGVFGAAWGFDLLHLYLRSNLADPDWRTHLARWMATGGLLAWIIARGVLRRAPPLEAQLQPRTFARRALFPLALGFASLVGASLGAEFLSATGGEATGLLAAMIGVLIGTLAAITETPDTRS